MEIVTCGLQGVGHSGEGIDDGATDTGNSQHGDRRDGHEREDKPVLDHGLTPLGLEGLHQRVERINQIAQHVHPLSSESV